MRTIGGLDHLMLNHAILTKPEYWESADEDLQMIERVVRVNFMSFVYLASHAMPYLVKSQGSIGVASSVSGIVLSNTFFGFAFALYCAFSFH